MSTADIAGYVICVAILLLHAQRRFNTPQTNRSTTRQRLYRQAVIGYMLSTLALFAVLSCALRLEAMRQLLLDGIVPGGAGAGQPTSETAAKLQSLSALPAPYIAALILTTLLPNTPWLSDIDQKLLDVFKTMANIPSEVQRRAARLTPNAFRVEQHDLPGLATFIEEASNLPDGLQRHLRADPGSGLQISQFRFTRVVKLYRDVAELAAGHRYQRFFADYAEEWSKAQAEFQKFCLRSSDGLDIAVRYRDTNAPEVYEDLMREARESFRLQCRQSFDQLTLLAAGAVLSSESSEHAIARTLRDMGFTVEDEATPDFPLQDLIGLAICLVAYLMAVHIGIHRWLPPRPHAGAGHLPRIAMPFFFGAVHTATTMATV